MTHRVQFNSSDSEETETIEHCKRGNSLPIKIELFQFLVLDIRIPLIVIDGRRGQLVMFNEQNMQIFYTTKGELYLKLWCATMKVKTKMCASFILFSRDLTFTYMNTIDRNTDDDGRCQHSAQDLISMYLSGVPDDIAPSKAQTCNGYIAFHNLFKCNTLSTNGRGGFS